MKREKVHIGWKYAGVAYIVFIVMVLGICGTASIVFHASPLMMRVLSNICAWSPTIVLFVGFGYWCKGMSVAQFFQRVFAGKIKIGLLLGSALSTGLTFLIAAFIYSCVKQVPFASAFTMGTTPLVCNVLLSLFSGPTGEECGWRGYLRYEFVQKYGFLKGNLLVGLVWTFWHGILWAVDSDYTSGMQVIIYIFSNIVVITAMHMIMAVIMEKEDNLLYAIVIHFFFNLPYCFLNADILFYIIIMPMYALVAGILCYVRQKRVLYTDIS